MLIRSNLSYWWMTLPTDNSLAADSPAYRVLRLFALSSVAAGMNFDHVEVMTDRRAVAEAVALWADSIGKPCKVDFNDPSTDQPNSHQRSRGPILAALRVFWNHLLISMQPSRKAGRAATKEGIIFIDYLAHLQKPGLDGAFRSNYWGPLVELLEDWPEPVNWLHIPANYATPTVISSDVDKCETFNAVHPAHSLLHSYLDLKTVFRALRDYVRIRSYGKELWKQRDLFVETGTRLDPSPLLHELVQDQYFGRTAALNAFWINMWESTIHALPMQRLGVYLFENQPWELAFLSAWQRSHFGMILALVHSSMRFWDLRYFSGKNPLSGSSKPTPDSVVVNGPWMKRSALFGGYPEHLLKVAEALRLKPGGRLESEPSVDLLVLGEYETMQDQQLVNVALDLANTLHPAARVTYRPHPTANDGNPTIPSHWSRSQHGSIGAALTASRVALCGPTSSVALDARLHNRTVVVIALADTLSSSPSLGLPNVHLKVPSDSASFPSWSTLTRSIAPLTSEVLLADPSLRRWRTLLQTEGFDK